jgi:AraC-like DNA-binding protein
LRTKQDSSAALSAAAQAYIEAHSAEKFSLDKMAKALFVNGSYLTRAFKHHTGMTPLVYHHRMRCAKAKELLTHSGLTISQVGEAVGYVSSSHFAHIFRKLEDCTPSEFQKNHKPETEEGTE